MRGDFDEDEFDDYDLRPGVDYDDNQFDAALENIAMAARRGLAFGHQATPQTPERMIERKEQALGQILDVCERYGVTSSVLRGSPGPAPVAPPTETQHWSVSVDRNGQNLVTIESNCLSGQPEFSDEDAHVIRECAAHLLAFIGAPPAVAGGDAPPEIQVDDVLVSKSGNRWRVQAVSGSHLLLHNVPEEAPRARGTVAHHEALPEWAAAIERHGGVIWRRRQEGQ